MTNNSAKLQIRDVLVCDDIRKEDNGKALLIGVYSSDILVSKFPFQRLIALWFHGSATKGVYELQIRIHIVSNNENTPPVMLENTIKADFSELKGPEVSISVVGLGLIIEEPSDLIVEVMYEGLEEWLELSRKTVSLNPSSSELELPFAQ